MCCKKIKKYLRPEEIQSDNVYRELSMKHMAQEYEKTNAEMEGMRDDAEMKERLRRKMHEMLTEMRARIVSVKQNGELPIDRWTDKEVTQKIEEMAKDTTMVGIPEVRGKMISKMYSYDFADNERYMDLKKLITLPLSQAIVDKVRRKK